MAKFADDKRFTDFVHQNLALPLIYSQLKWQEIEPNPQHLQILDNNNGVDYLFRNHEGRETWVQERFRDSKYKNYADFTLRYRRDHNPHADRQLSEFYKIRADYMVYGITNGSKLDEKRESLSGFLKFAVVDLGVLRYQYKKKRILPKEGLRQSVVVDGVMHAPVIDNHDKSSSFIAFDIAQLQMLFGEEDIILLQKGFY